MGFNSDYGGFAGGGNGSSPGGPAGGDLSGSYPNPEVIGLRGNAIPANAAGFLYNNGSGVLTWSAAQNITVVANYSALPAASAVPDQFYWVSNSQGTAWLPGSLGGTYYNNGLYYSNGVTWEFLSVPYQATQTAVNNGVATDQFVTPATLKNSTQWNTKQDALSGIGFVKINGTTISYDNSTYLTTISGIAAGGELSGTYPNPTLLNSAVIGKVLTGYVSGAGTISPADSILSAIQKLNGNIGAVVSSQWVSAGSDIYYATGNVMIGNATAPLTKLHVVETSTATLRGALFGQYSNDTLSSKVTTRKARGTYASPTAIQVADVLSNWTTAAYDGTSFIDAASIRTTSVGTIGTGRIPTKMEFMTMTDVTTGVLTTALTLDQSQNAIFTSGAYVPSVKVLKFGGTPGTLTDYLDAFTNSGVANGLYIGSGFTTTTIAPGSTLRIPATTQMLDSAGTARALLVSTSPATLTFGASWNLITASTAITVAGVFTASSQLIGNASSNFTSGTFYWWRNSVSMTATGGAFNTFATTWESILNQTGATGIMAGFAAIPSYTSISGKAVGFYSSMSSSVTGGGSAWSNYHDGSAPSWFNHALWLGSGKGLADSNGVYLLNIATTVPSAVNYFSITNSVASSPVILSTAGADSAIQMRFQTKGTITGTAFYFIGNTSTSGNMVTYQNTLSSAGDNSIVLLNGTASSTTNRNVIQFVCSDSGAASTVKAYIWGGGSIVTSGSVQSTFGIDTLTANVKATRFQIDGSLASLLNGTTLGIGTSAIASSNLVLSAGTTTKSQINFISGTAPTSPNDGDMWYDGTNVKFRVGGTTKTFTLV